VDVEAVFENHASAKEADSRDNIGGHASLASIGCDQAAHDHKHGRSDGKDVRSLKKQTIAANMNLTDAEAEQFSPIYDRYTAELVTITNTKYTLLKEYAQNYTTITGEQAAHYIKGRADVEESTMGLRLKYLPIFRKVLSGTATALFFQLDWRLGLIMDLQLASQTPSSSPEPGPVQHSIWTPFHSDVTFSRPVGFCHSPNKNSSASVSKA